MSAAKRQRELNRAKKEHENAKLSAQIATGNVVLTNIAESVMAKLIERQAAQIEMMREALSKIEYLESANGCIMSAGDCSSVATEALSTTPDQALEQFAAKVREQCAQMLLNGSFLHDQAPDKLLAAEAAKAIRAIKELPQ